MCALIVFVVATANTHKHRIPHPWTTHTHRVTYTYTVTRQSFFDVFYFSQFSLDIYFAIVFALLFVQLTICVDNYRFDGKL